MVGRERAHRVGGEGLLAGTGGWAGLSEGGIVGGP